MVWFTDADLRDLAGSRSYQRGVGYLDAIGEIGDLPDGVVATVHGGGRYRVRLTGSEDGVLAGDCSCPYGQDGFFCKHCVAVGLRLLAEPDPAPSPGPGPTVGRGGVGATTSRASGRPGTTPADIKRFLTEMDHDELVELIWRQAGEDAALFQRLQLLTATNASNPDLALLRQQVKRLQVDWIAYGDEHAYVAGAEAVLDALVRLSPEHAVTVQALLRRALTHIGAAAGASEDESGIVIEAADTAWDAYRRACAAAPPDPVELGRWFVDFQLDDSDWPETSLADLTDLLGEPGLAAYRQRLDEVGRTHARHWRLRSMREELVDATGDTDALVACLAEDLSGPHQYLRIATLLRQEQRLKEAVDWLERGLDSANPGPFDHRMDTLVDPLAELYPQVGRAADVVALRERHFTATGSEPAYRALRTAAEAARQWPEIHPRALAVLRQRAESQGRYAADTFVGVLLDEGEVTQAWKAISGYDTCTGQVRLAVANRRAETHPEDAIAVYRPMVDAAVARTSRDGYAQAAKLLLTMRGFYAQTGADFGAELRRLKETNRRKRNFLAELDRNGL